MTFHPFLLTPSLHLEPTLSIFLLGNNLQNSLSPPLFLFLSFSNLYTKKQKPQLHATGKVSPSMQKEQPVHCIHWTATQLPCNAACTTPFTSQIPFPVHFPILSSCIFLLGRSSRSH